MDHDSEKVGVEHVPSAVTGANSDKGSTDNPLNYFTPEEQVQIKRRVDRRLVTTLGFMYCVSLMDRTNLGAANIAGMAKELVLTGDRYVSLFWSDAFASLPAPVAGDLSGPPKARERLAY